MNKQIKQQGINVKTLYKDNRKVLKLRCLSPHVGFERKIVEKDLHRPGLALAGFVELFTFRRVQIFGNTEIAFLNKQSLEKRRKILEGMFSFEIPCIIITDNNEPPEPLVEMAAGSGSSVFVTPFSTTYVFQNLGDYLEEKFAPRINIHGSLVDVYGVGILFTGKSGIGKSEVALDLISRGHRLIADDQVTLIRLSSGTLIGIGNETLSHNMEIRGVGIIDIRAVFGIRGVRKQKRVEVQIELINWDKNEKYERLGLTEVTSEILGGKIPLIRLPVYPGKNISVISELIALNHLLRFYGHHAARNLEDRLTRKMKKKIQEIGESVE